MDIEYRKSIAKHSGGFTMIEITSVILILAIIGAIAVSRIASTKPYNVAAEVETLKANLRYAQFRALSDADKRLSSNATTWGISFSGNSYTLQKTEEGVPTTPNLPGDNSPTHTLPSGITVSGSNVTFDAWGSPGGSNITITVTDGTSPQTITVTQNTGFIP